MKRRMSRASVGPVVRIWGARIVLAMAFGLAAGGSAFAQDPVGTAFTYQAFLSMNGEPLTGTADFRFTLWNADQGGDPVAGPVPVDNVEVENGLILMPIDLDVAPWTSDTAYWLEIQVRSPSGMGDFVTLQPRQRVTPTPASLSTRGIDVDDEENVGIGTSTPEARLHVRGSDLPPLRGGCYDPENDEIVEDTSGAARLEVYSGATGVGGFGSGVSLAEDCTDKWGLLRHTAGAGSGFVMTYGANADPITNDPMFEIQALGNTLLNPMLGYTGIAEAAPYTQLHVTDDDLPYDFSWWLSGEEVVLEDDKRPWLGLYTGNEQEGFGAGITLGEVLMSERDKWSIFRQDQNGQTRLSVTWGQNADPFANPARMRIWQGGDTLLAPVAGRVGIGFDYEPLAKLHVVENDLPRDYSAALAYEDILVVDTDPAFIGLYADAAGGIVSGITLAEVPDDPADPVNKWAMYCRTSSNVGDLNFTYGEDDNPGANDKVMQLKRNGDVGIGVNTPAGKLHVYMESTVPEDNVAVFEKQSANDYAVAIGGRRIDAVNMAGGADPDLLLNYYVTGDVILVYGSGHASGGNVAIGRAYPPTERLDVDGTARLRGISTPPGPYDVRVDASGVLTRSSSSLRYKKNVRSLPSDPAAVLNLRPVAFDWRSTSEPDVGLIAEEVAQVLPELVVWDDEGRPDAVRYNRVALYLLEVVKQQQQRLAALEEVVEQSRSLQARVAELEHRISQTSVGAK